MAQTGAGEIAANADNMMAMEKDQPYLKEVRDKISGDIDKWTKAKNWEDFVEPVRNLGRYYANRSKELAAPLAQFQEYSKGIIDSKDYTPFQKKSYIARSKEGYQGLTRDPSGRLSGSFQGVTPAKYVDLPTWTQGVLKDLPIFKHASSIERRGTPGSADEHYLVTRGSKTEEVTMAQVQDALAAAINLSPEVQAYIADQGDNTGYWAGKTDVNTLPDQVEGQIPLLDKNGKQVKDKKGNLQYTKGMVQNAVKAQVLAEAAKTGRDPSEIYGEQMNMRERKDLLDSMDDFARRKFVFKNTDYTYGLAADAVSLSNRDRADRMSTFGDVVPGQGIDFTKEYSNASAVNTDIKNITDATDAAQTSVNATKAAIATSYGMKAEDIAKLTPAQIQGYFAKNPTMAGKYEADLQLVDGNKQRLAALNQLRDESLDLAIKKKNGPGASFAQMKANATRDLGKDLEKNKSTITLNGTMDGKRTATKLGAADFQSTDPNKGFEVIDGDKGFATSDNYLTIRDKATGKEYKIQTQVGTGDYDNMAGNEGDGVYVTSKTGRDIGGRFDGLDWKSEWEQGAKNVRTNSAWIPVNDRSQVDGKPGLFSTRVAGILRAGTVEIKNGDLTSMGTTDQDEFKKIIDAGKFDVLGVSKTSKSGKVSMKLSVLVDDKEDKTADKYKTIVVDVDSNIGNQIGNAAIDAGRRNGDLKSIQVGSSLKFGSGYEKVLDMGPTGRVQINQSSPDGKTVTPIYEVVPSQTGNGLSYKVWILDGTGKRVSVHSTYGDAHDLGLFLDENSTDGRFVVPKNTDAPMKQ
jgi:hypothetical protein